MDYHADIPCTSITLIYDRFVAAGTRYGAMRAASIESAITTSAANGSAIPIECRINDITVR